ncbi:MAG: helix-turn-helix domain-containing protein [Actinophytocola sp.]|uniref:helix-turn-helix domain-containing protein n=1 Tax=Actinophytocola sp. TaxID=1872138 RepID=UPI00132ADCD4|nr:helix-turn-helix transcriptional regulator [Actinophytocola sp.]MPZ85469.1 helix-turn-helix domain-containing protein [Actinophytocola sp.]
MTTAVDHRAEMIQRVLGDELRNERKGLGWTRRDLAAALGQDISLQTLATYELGTRQCGVVRLWELTEALKTSLPELWSRVMDRIGDEGQVSGLTIDLQAAAKTTLAKLGPLARWAKTCLRTLPDGQQPVVRLDRAALESMAELCGTDTTDLVHRLQDRRAGLTNRRLADQ